MRRAAVRERMIEERVTRGAANQHVGRVRGMFRWERENELVPPFVHQAPMTASGLQKGLPAAREPEPIVPVSEAAVEAVRSSRGRRGP